MDKKFRILFVEDEEALGEIVKESLEIRGFEVTYCNDGKEGEKAFRNQQFDVCILDVMMPFKDGFSLAKDIRGVNQDIPILFVTAMTQPKDVVKGFECGCNDYIRKPFSMEELIVRINALLNKPKVVEEKSTEGLMVEHFGDFTYHEQEEVLVCKGVKTKLTPRESRLLKILLLNKNRLTKRDEILENLWGRATFFNGRSLDVFVTKLRKRLASDISIEIITVRGEGIKLVCSE
ncbi:MAG: response regulator transcription factor [Bacteroidales bacterium]